MSVSGPTLALKDQRRADLPPPDPSAPTAIEIGGTSKGPKSVAVAAITKGIVGKLTRYGQVFDYTPFSAVLKLAAIPPGARVRVIGEDETLDLQTGSAFDPANYAVIRNPRGFLVLTPLPTATKLPTAGSGGARSGSGPPAGALPPPGSRGGAGFDPSQRPPGSGGGAAGGPPTPGSGAKPGTPVGTGGGSGRPEGFDELKEVRRFTRIEVVR